MFTDNQCDESTLQFEGFPARVDIKVSKVMTTKKGDKIRAVVTSGQSLMLTNVGQPDGDTVIVIGDPGYVATPFSLGGFWDIAKGIGISVIKGILGGGGGGGGGCKPTTSVTIEVGPGGNITKITTTATCSPA